MVGVHRGEHGVDELGHRDRTWHLLVGAHVAALPDQHGSCSPCGQHGLEHRLAGLAAPIVVTDLWGGRGPEVVAVGCADREGRLVDAEQGHHLERHPA